MNEDEKLREELENNPVIRFIQSRTFYVIALILIAVGIIVALLSGGIPSSRVPAPNQQVKPWYER